MKKKHTLQNFKIYVIGDTKAAERKNVIKVVWEKKLAKIFLNWGKRDSRSSAGWTRIRRDYVWNIIFKCGQMWPVPIPTARCCSVCCHHAARIQRVPSAERHSHCPGSRPYSRWGTMLMLGTACSGPTHGLSGHQPPSRESNTLNTSWHVITKKSHYVLSKYMILCWTTFIAILGRMWPAGHRPDTPALEDVPKACHSFQHVCVDAFLKRISTRSSSGQLSFPLSLHAKVAPPGLLAVLCRRPAWQKWTQWLRAAWSVFILTLMMKGSHQMFYYSWCLKRQV